MILFVAPFVMRGMEDMGADLVSKIKAKLQIQKHVATGKLMRSVVSKVGEIPRGFTLDIYAEDYADYVERGRAPGRAPFDKILKWVLVKGLHRKITKFLGKPESLAWAVVRNKMKYGTPTPNRPDFKFKFIEDTVEKDEASRIDKKVDDIFGVEAFKNIDNLMKRK